MSRFAQEGHVEVEGGRIWYGFMGDLTCAAAPLIVVHGGPGMSHDYLIALGDLAQTRAVIFYDQLDAGRSERPNTPANWHLARFTGEIDALRRALDLPRVAVFGNSWGGTVAAAYGATRPEGLEALILSSPLLQTNTWLADNAAHRAALPVDVLRVMDAHEAAGTTDDPAYEAAVETFYQRHLCRVDPWPEEVLATFETLNETCYAGMWGPNEFTCTGVLRGYDGTADLARITAPTLVTCGAYDEATPASTARFAAMIPGAEFEVFPASSHMAFIEERASYIATLRSFLSR